jgi:tetratricopeptide (TPR) repeat protein
LTASGVPAAPEDLEPELFVPERRGALQLELVGAVRRRERVPVVVDGELDALVAQLQANRPVLVLQNLALRWLPRWHYAVLVGYDPDLDHFVLRSGTTERETLSRHRFQATWDRADRWALVLLAPEETPRAVTRAAYLQGAAGLEGTGHHVAALQAFDSALTRWPDEPIALLGRANNLYHLGRLEAAEDAYRRLLAAAPADRAGVSNLVTLLLERNRGCAAAEVLATVPDPDLPWLAPLAADPRLQTCEGPRTAPPR